MLEVDGKRFTSSERDAEISDICTSHPRDPAVSTPIYLRHPRIY